MPTPASNHARNAEHFAHLIDGVTDWDAPTPVPQWRARDVVEHLLTWPVALLANRAGLVLDDDAGAPLPERWARRAADLQRALEDPAVAAQPVSAGMFDGAPLGQLIDNIYTADVFLHSWDLARSSGQPAGLDPEIAAATLGGMRQAEEAIRSSGQFGPEVATDSADPVDQLMAFIGRDPAWRSPTAAG